MIEDKEDCEFLSTVSRWKTKSGTDRLLYDDRWSRNLRIIKGIFEQDENSWSKTRNRAKINFRKVEAITWRLVAAFYRSFLAERDSFEFGGRMGSDNDFHRAKVFQEVVQYHVDSMNRHQSLMKKHLWAFKNISDLGLGVAKLWWNKDHPEYVLYPNEQVFADWSAEHKEDMGYIILVNYMTKEKMEEMGFENIDKAQFTSVKNEQLRNVRHQTTGDPGVFGEDEYPSPGKSGETSDGNLMKEKTYAVWEVFYKKDGKHWLGYTNENNVVLKKAEESIYDHYPIIMGQCLLEPHKAIGTGFPEILEGPNESFNVTMNQRKDNVSLVLNPMTLVSRFGNVDLDSLTNSRPGGITLTDDMGGIEDRRMPDVTQNAYMEAAIDEGMMQELSGITPGKEGMGSASQKATVARINEQNADVKISLFIAIVAETYMKPFYHELAWQVNKFESNKKILRIANDSFKSKNPSKLPSELLPMLEDVSDFDDLEMDMVLKVGKSEYDKDVDLRKLSLIMDKAIMANQSQMQLLQVGLMQPEGVKLYNLAAFEDEIMRLLGVRNIKDFIITVQQPAQAPQNQAVAGAMTPQIGGDITGTNVPGGTI